MLNIDQNESNMLFMSFHDVFQTDGNRVITTSWYCSSCMFDINFNIGFDSIIYNPSSLCENIVVVTEIDVSRC